MNTESERLRFQRRKKGRKSIWVCFGQLTRRRGFWCFWKWHGFWGDRPVSL